MKLTFAAVALPTLFLAVGAARGADAVHPKFGFPVYKNVVQGRQLSGQHAPAATPALSPEESQKRFKVPDGFQVRLFAAEPDIANPVAMTWDDRGRLWVLELYEYPLGAKAGQKPRDRVKILEDTDGDGRADKVTVFADGFNLATGLLVDNHGVYVGAAPNLWYLEDTDGDDVADRRTIVQTGFGLEDRHELLNGFTWGPDGQMYMTHGVFTVTKALNPDKPGPPVLVSAGVARFDTRSRQLEVFAEGTSNPWGVDFDRYGNAFVSACVIDHLFHLAPGGLYQRQAGQPPYPYAYELLPSIVDHKHHMAAYSGVCIYQGDQWPASWQGEVLMGNIHQSAINHDHLTPDGSSFKAKDAGDFLTTTDEWFRPVSTQVGPDGAVWIMDWYDAYPCYQNANADPEGVDRERGRIWRVVWTGGDAAKPVPPRPSSDMSLAKLSGAELVKQLEHPNEWQRRMAQRILSGRGNPALDPATSASRTPLRELFKSGKTLEARLAAFWTLYSTGLMDDALLDAAAADSEPAVRTWAARFTGERRRASDATTDRLVKLANDREASVRSAVASACRQLVSGSLTVNTPRPESAEGAQTGPALMALIEKSKDAQDPLLPFLIWMAAEPLVVQAPSESLGWFAERGREYLPLTARLLTKTTRRFCETGEAKHLDATVEFLADLPADSVPLLKAALDGLIEGQKGKAIAPTKPTGPLLAKLLAHANKDVVSRAQQLGTLWGDAAALQATLAKVNDTGAPEPDRLQAIQAARQSKTDAAREALTAVLQRPNSDAVTIEIIRALSEVGGDGVGELLVRQWRSLSAASRRAAGETLVSRRGWARAFLAAIERKEISPSDLPVTTIRAFMTSKDDYVRNNATRAIGRYRETTADKLKLIADKRKVVLNGPIDLSAGHEVAKKTCFVCHKLHGEGADVGPDLTGVGRSSLDALLHNVINPNEIIGTGYENVVIETKDGRTVQGRLVENSDTRVKLLLQGPQEEVIAKSDIQSQVVSENSVMPEGLENLPDDEFRNLIWFILAPPQDGRPLTPERKKELIGDVGSASAGNILLPTPLRDGESVALWNPEWRVDGREIDGAPARLPEFAGRQNVLRTRPHDAESPAALVRPFVVPAAGRTTLTFAVAADSGGEWELRVVADGELIHHQRITAEGDRWRTIRVDLTRFAGSRLVLRLENQGGGSAPDSGYWSDIRLDRDDVASAAR